MAGYSSPATVGNGSWIVNSQLLPSPMSNAFYPSMASAPFYKGSGQPPPTVPLSYMGGSGAGTDQQTSMAAANPFDFFHSPLIIALAALVIGILGLRYVHWR